MLQHDYFIRQEQKRKEARDSNEISTINRGLKIQLQKLQSSIDREDFRSEAKELSRNISHCSIWDINYRNNMESKDVAVAQALLINAILSKAELEDGSYVKHEVDSLMRRLGNVDWGLYLEYGRRLRRYTKK